ncbi:NAD(P)/FAD-dependent oxidoreductase [Williamsia deligens]|uniref:NAD(P)/FAD-dependent oxidoreductase n=1 Tax=Williamsia deligens TaxID=321325 RepID=A0ABW3GBT6_9NOCA|nr:FAD-dependent oxidoreductase [Williamsia deligens]MCP2195476.1 NADPH-dependent 2,4-dienoyl-CoA reductase, sulfur reductase [Williamsia deligens]
MIGIVGASLAGLTVARTLRSLGVDEPVVFVGAEPWHPYDRPPLSKELLSSTYEAAPTAPDPGWATLLADGEHDAFDWRLGVSATGLSRTGDDVSIHTDHGHVPARAVVLTTGARAMRLPGDDLVGVHAVRTIDDARRLAAELTSAEDVVVVGAGFIGAEIASTVTGQGRHVTVVERAPDPGARVLGRRLASWAVDLQRRAGVDVRTGTGIAGFESEGGVVRGVRLADGTSLRADVVVVGVGAVPNTSWAAGSAVAVDDGFLTDQRGATSMPGVWAAGDCARVVDAASGVSTRHQHWSAAIESARTVAHGIAGLAPPSPRAPYVWSEQHGHRVQICGTIPPDAEPTVLEGSLDDDAFLAVVGDPDAPDAVVGVDSPRSFTRLRKSMDRRMSAVAAVHA